MNDMLGGVHYLPNGVKKVTLICMPPSFILCSILWPHIQNTRIFNPLAIWIHVYTCLSGCKLEYCLMLFLMSVIFSAQLPHSYYFNTRILVLKFVNKGVFFVEIQDLHFHRKRGYFGTQLREFWEKGVIFYLQCFTVKRGVHLGWQVSVLPQKRGFILDWKVSSLSQKKGVVLSWKVSVLPQKRGSFSNWRTRMGTIFFSEWWSQGSHILW